MIILGKCICAGACLCGITVFATCMIYTRCFLTETIKTIKNDTTKQGNIENAIDSPL